MRLNAAGFSIVELLAAAAVAGLMMAGGMQLLAAQHANYTTEASRAGMEENLRVALNVVADALRGAGNGVPSDDLGAWIPWYSFGSDPIELTTTPTSRLTVARCLPYTVAELSGPALAGDTTLDVSSSIAGSSVGDLLDTDAKRLILIDGQEHAHITAVSGGRIAIDSDPLLTNPQGLSRGYPTGTPICRVDVVTFYVETRTDSGRPELRVDTHQGGDDEAVAEGITELQLRTVTAGKVYEVGLIADGDLHDRVSGAVLQGSLRTFVTLRN